MWHDVFVEPNFLRSKSQAGTRASNGRESQNLCLESCSNTEMHLPTADPQDLNCDCDGDEVRPPRAKYYYFCCLTLTTTGTVRVHTVHTVVSN